MPQPKQTMAPQASFEDCLQRVQAVVEQLEGGDLSLEESLELFTEGIGLVRQCQEKLAEAEQKVELLLVDKEGQTHRQPLNPLGGSDRCV